MTTTFSLRDLGISPGQARSEQLELRLSPYFQGSIEYVASENCVPACLDITSMTEGLSFRLRFSVSYVGPCSRCLESAVWNIDVDAHAVHNMNEDDVELRCEHVDDHLQKLDVTAWAQEETSLQFPTKVLCSQTCKGLCSDCGINLNDNPDHMHEKVTDSRWDALKDLKLDSNEDDL